MRTFVKERSGNVAVEFALVLPMTLLLLSGLIEYGLVTYDDTSLENAARAGAQYAFSGGYSESKVDAAVRAASTLTLSKDAVSSAVYCECSDTTPITCGEPCPDGGPNRRFIRVDISEPHEPFLPFMAYIVPDRVEGGAIIRMQ
jgi:hypothetical protein